MDVYEISSEKESLQGVGMRYNLRFVAAENNIPLSADNLPDNKVRFTVAEGTDIASIVDFVKKFKPTAIITKVEK